MSVRDGIDDLISSMVRTQDAAIARIEKSAVAPTLEVLKKARDELRHDLAAWLSRIDNPEDTFTAKQLRAALRATGRAISRMEESALVMEESLRVGSASVGRLASAAVGTEIDKFGALLGEPMAIPQVDVVSVLSEGKQLLWPRYVTSAKRYAGAFGEDVRGQLALGVAKNETFFEMSRRLQRYGGGATGSAVWNPGGTADAFANGVFSRSAWNADRLVRTEMMHAYNVQHVESIEALNDDLDHGEKPFGRKWDASMDRRTCRMCSGLEGKTAKIGEPFDGGIDHPPAHPCCRCVEVAWHPSWD